MIKEIILMREVAIPLNFAKKIISQDGFTTPMVNINHSITKIDKQY
jgi:hypothetical protein